MPEIREFVLREGSERYKVTMIVPDDQIDLYDMRIREMYSYGMIDGKVKRKTVNDDKKTHAKTNKKRKKRK